MTSQQEEAIEGLEAAQGFLREAVEQLNFAQRTLNSMVEADAQRLSESIYRQVLGNLEPLIDSEHRWLSKGEHITGIIEEVKLLDQVDCQDCGTKHLPSELKTFDGMDVCESCFESSVDQIKL